MKRRQLYLILFASICPLFLSCLWDRDTLAEEAKGKTQQVQTLIGWLDRYPDKYYEMRLERVKTKLSEQPNDLNLYDDAAVALDRLHRSKEAIAFMLEKKKRIDLLEDSELKAEHEYRYLANVGTFYAHRWIGKSKVERESDYTDLLTAAEFIADAIELNPEAHFGREKYQYRMLRWLTPEDVLDSIAEGNNASPIPEWDQSYESEMVVEGLLGIVRLGAAWKSVDVHAALVGPLAYQEDASLALIAELRVQELIEEGGQSLHRDPNKNNMLPDMAMNNLENDEPVRTWYAKAREVVKSRNALRDLYILERLEKGEHPDTHPEFWAEWKELDLPEMPDGGLLGKEKYLFIKIGIVAVCGLLGVCIIVAWWFRRMTRKNVERISFDLG